MGFCCLGALMGSAMASIAILPLPPAIMAKRSSSMCLEAYWTAPGTACSLSVSYLSRPALILSASALWRAGGKTQPISKAGSPELRLMTYLAVT